MARGTGSSIVAGCSPGCNMNQRKWILVAVALALIGGSAAVLARVKSHQKLGEPGLRATRIEGSPRLDIPLPEKVPNFASTFEKPDQEVVDGLPHDTSFAVRLYSNRLDTLNILMSVVMMGSDRTSIHKPEFCLQGKGWRIDSSDVQKIPIQRPFAYELPVIRKMVSREVAGSTYRGIYVYWYVADKAVSADATGFERMWSSARTLLTTGVLQRWAYVSCFAVCLPGQEEPAFNDMKKLISDAVPQFQLSTGPSVLAGTAAGSQKLANAVPQ